MASTTTNLNLQLLGTSSSDKATLFEDWRQTINGEATTSNMQIIDRAYGEMAEYIEQIKDGAVTDEEIDALFA